MLVFLSVAVQQGCDTTAGDDPIYIVQRKYAGDPSPDTLARLEFRSEPAYMKSVVMDIEWYPSRHAEDSLRLDADRGAVCAFTWDKMHHTWYGDFDESDTLRCSFLIRPLQVGKLVLGFSTACTAYSRCQALFTLTFDHTGRFVRENTPKPVYGALGPLPEVMPDTFCMAGGCNVSLSFPRSGHIDVSGKMWPPPGEGEHTTIEWTLIPRCDLVRGVYYVVGYDDIFDLELVDDTDWPDEVSLGDTLVVRARVRPTKPGVGTINIHVVGGAIQPGDTTSSSKHDSMRGSAYGKWSLDFAFDRRMKLQACAPRLPVYADLVTVDYVDRYRLRVVDALRCETYMKKVFSWNYGSRGSELLLERDNQRY